LQKGAKYIIEMDAGGSHDPKEIPNFIKYLDEGYDCVFGSRFIRGGNITSHSLSRVLISRLGTILSKVFLGLKCSDITGGFEAFKYGALKSIDLDAIISKGNSWHIEMKYFLKDFKSKEIPIHYFGSKSSFKYKLVLEALQILWLIKIGKIGKNAVNR